MRIAAQEVLKKENYRRRVFEEKASKVKTDKAIKQAFLEEAVLHFASDILDEFNIPSIPTIAIGTLRGFEKDTQDFNTGTGFIEAYASFRTMSTVVIRMDLLIPIIRGEIYRPSVVRINGKKVVFSPFIIDAILASAETIRPVFSGLFTNHPEFVHVDNVEHLLFQVPQGEFAEVVHDRYISDDHRM